MGMGRGFLSGFVGAANKRFASNRTAIAKKREKEETLASQKDLYTFQTGVAAGHAKSAAEKATDVAAGVAKTAHGYKMDELGAKAKNETDKAARVQSTKDAENKIHIKGAGKEGYSHNILLDTKEINRGEVLNRWTDTIGKWKKDGVAIDPETKKSLFTKFAQQRGNLWDGDPEKGYTFESGKNNELVEFFGADMFLDSNPELLAPTGMTVTRGADTNSITVQVKGKEYQENTPGMVEAAQDQWGYNFENANKLGIPTTELQDYISNEDNATMAFLARDIHKNSGPAQQDTAFSIAMRMGVTENKGTGNENVRMFTNEETGKKQIHVTPKGTEEIMKATAVSIPIGSVSEFGPDTKRLAKNTTVLKEKEINDSRKILTNIDSTLNSVGNIVNAYGMKEEGGKFVKDPVKTSVQFPNTIASALEHMSHKVRQEALALKEFMDAPDKSGMYSAANLSSTGRATMESLLDGISPGARVDEKRATIEYHKSIVVFSLAKMLDPGGRISDKDVAFVQNAIGANWGSISTAEGLMEAMGQVQEYVLDQRINTQSRVMNGKYGTHTILADRTRKTVTAMEGL